MSKHPTSGHTPEEKIIYWKGRITDKTLSGYRDFITDFSEAVSWARGCGFDLKELNETSNKIDELMKTLVQNILELKKIEEKPTSEPFKEKMQVKENVQVQLVTPGEQNETIAQPVQSQ